MEQVLLHPGVHLVLHFLKADDVRLFLFYVVKYQSPPEKETVHAVHGGLAANVESYEFHWSPPKAFV